MQFTRMDDIIVELEEHKKKTENMSDVVYENQNHLLELTTTI